MTSSHSARVNYTDARTNLVEGIKPGHTIVVCIDEHISWGVIHVASFGFTNLLELLNENEKSQSSSVTNPFGCYLWN